MDYLEKAIIATIPLVIGLIIKAINYFFNLTGDKDKISKEKADLLKSVLTIENSLHIREYRILHEEAFSIAFKTNVFFNEIKNLIYLDSPKKAFKLYLQARPYIRPCKLNDGFEYRIWNRIRFGKLCLPLPVYRTSLALIYVMCEVFGLTLLIYQLGKIDSIIKNASVQNSFTYINFVGLIFISFILIFLGCKALFNLYVTPSRTELQNALIKLNDREVVVIKDTSNS